MLISKRSKWNIILISKISASIKKILRYFLNLKNAKKYYLNKPCESFVLKISSLKIENINLQTISNEEKI